MSDTTNCRRCGAEVEADSLFCSRCGQDMTLLGDDGPTPEVTTAGTPVMPVRSMMRQALRDATLGEYEILSELGRGGMATVFLAHDIALDRKVAIKVMAPHLLEGEGLAERFKLEARTAAQLSHPHIIPIYAVKETADTLFFVMKFVEGRGLDEVIKKIGPLPIPMVRDILGKVAGALGYAHRRNVVHRDIKPANIMIDEEGTPIVTDFGIAKVSETKGLTMTGATIGTPSYMSPEQCEAKPVTGGSDQYSLGIVAFEMLTGRLPFEGSSAVTMMYKHCHEPLPPLEDFRPDCPADIRETVVRMSSKAPKERWPSLEAAARKLAQEATPTSVDPIRSHLMELVREGDTDELLARLSDPNGPAAKGTGPQTGGRVTTARRLGIAAAVILVLGAAGAVAVIRPWAGSAAGGVAGASVSPTGTGAARGSEPPGQGAQEDITPPTVTADGSAASTPNAGPANAGTAPASTSSSPADPPASGGGGPPATASTVASVEISGGPPGPLLPGGQARLSADPLDASSRTVSRQEVRWRSSNQDVATVDANGLVRAVRPGQADITASVAGVSASYPITVGQTPVAVLTVGNSELVMEIGDQATVRAETHAADGGLLTGRRVTWSSNNTGVVQVSGGGVTAAGEGTATITATSEGRTATVAVTVRVPIQTAVEQVVAAYARALESRDIERIREVYPAMTAEQEQQLERALPTMEGLRVEYVIESLDEQTSLANTAVTATYRFRSGGRDFTQPTPLHFTFARTTTSWRLTGIR